MFFNLGLVGYPLGHSLSPKIHAAALASCGLEGDYSLFPIPPNHLEDLKALLDRLRSGELHGLNVTIPHKQNVIPLLDALTPTAQAIGAVNTIWMQNGMLTGDNTDAPGFLADLNHRLAQINTDKHDAANPKPVLSAVEASPIANPKSQPQMNTDEHGCSHLKSALVLGAGGSARAVVYALLNDDWNVTVAARRLEQAQELVSHYASRTHYVSRITHHALRITPDALPSLPQVTLIVNTTPVGMTPDIHHSPWPANVPFPPHAAVYDLVYNPRETQLVKDARAAGLCATSGLGMLVEQAALSFERWTGCVAPLRTKMTSITCFETQTGAYYF